MIGFSISPAYAGPPVPSCILFDLDPGAGTDFGGIDPATFSCIIDNTLKTVTIIETWIGEPDSYVLFNNMDIFVDYSVTKIITNSITTGKEMISFSYELHDPAGNFNDGSVPDFTPCGIPGSLIPDIDNDVCPAGFSRSNDPDELSFSQGTPIPTVARDSLVFFTELPDEFNLIDFVDWMNSGPGGHFGRICNTLTIPTLSCPVASPTTDTQTFGLRDDKINGENQAYLLRQSLVLIGPPIVGGEMVSSDFAVLAIAGMKDNAFNILGILSLVGISTFAALYFTVKRK